VNGIEFLQQITQKGLERRKRRQEVIAKLVEQAKPRQKARADLLATEEGRIKLFLQEIALDKHSEKFKTWAELINSRSPILKKKQIPTKDRKKIRKAANSWKLEHPEYQSTLVKPAAPEQPLTVSSLFNDAKLGDTFVPGRTFAPITSDPPGRDDHGDIL